MVEGNYMTGRTKNLLKGALVAAFILTGAAFWYVRTPHNEGIFPYEASTDRAFILNLFKEDWYWLISDYSPDYSPENMLDTKSRYNNDPEKGILNIKTYRVQGKPAGFVAYHSGGLLEGYILFLAIGKEFRSKGYARTLMNYAINEFKKQGMRVVRLQTRTDNARGRKLYTSLGFKELSNDGAYVKYEKILNS
jgi:ribosomal protein S18 acetylase RimI-like enzyme